MRKVFAALVLLAAVLLACGLFTPPNEFPSPPPTVFTVEPPISVTKAPNPTFTPVSGGEYPEAALKAQGALASKLGISADRITIVSAEPVNWPDSCLGVSKPGIMCAMLITPGYRVILRANGTDYEYHTDMRDSVVLASQRPAVNP